MITISCIYRKRRERLKLSGWQLLAKDHPVVVALEEEELAKTNHSKMEDKREEEVGGATEVRGPVGRNMPPQEAANHSRNHWDPQLTTIISITITTTTVERMVAREPSQRHR